MKQPYSQTIKDRLKLFIKTQGIGQGKFEVKCGLSNGYVNNIRQSIQPDKLQKIALAFPNLNTGWLMTGEGEMLRNASSLPQPRKKIPVYDSQTIGGHNGTDANTDTPARIAEEIDAGDWFPEATAAIHHYGDSMVEYPSGSILALKRVNDRRLIINGRNYVIETTEFRVTKQLQYDGGDYIMAYSSNPETYPDGRQIHSPIRIPVETVRHIDLVLGCVTKEYSNGAVIIRNKTK